MNFSKAPILGLLFCLVGCETKFDEIAPVGGRSVTILFEGFVYRGSRPLGSTAAALHRDGIFPETLKPGVEFLFSRREDGQAEKMAVVLLPERLQRLGFEIEQAPGKDGRNLVFLDSGGPLFSIKARRGPCSLSIRKPTATDPSDPRSWSWAKRIWESGVYIIVVTGDSCAE